jgi:hypothetical protein
VLDDERDRQRRRPKRACTAASATTVICCGAIVLARQLQLASPAGIDRCKLAGRIDLREEQRAVAAGRDDVRDAAAC